jgi:hypothetical protein
VEFQRTISEQLLVLTISAPVRRIERAGGLDAVLLAIDILACKFSHTLTTGGAAARRCVLMTA